MARGRGAGGEPTSAEPREREAEHQIVGEARWPMATAVIATMILTTILETDLHFGRNRLVWLLVLLEGCCWSR